MARILSEFIECLAGASSHDELGRRAQRYWERIGFEKFAYLNSGAAPSEAKFLSNYAPGWIEHYVTNGYVEVDPVVRFVKTHSRSLAWGSRAYLRGLTPRERALFSEASEFGIRRGLSIAWRNAATDLVGVTVATGATEREFTRAVAETGNDLKLSSLYFCSCANHLGPLPPYDRGNLLSDKEAAALSWFAEGKSPVEISDRTEANSGEVMHLLGRAATKLGLSDIPHAAMIATRLGLVRI